MVIDTNIYWLPETLFTDRALRDAFCRAVPAAYDVRAIFYTAPDGRAAIKVEKPGGYENLNYFAGDYALEKQLSAMDAAGVDKAVMKLPGCQEWLTLDLCRAFNDAAAEFSKQSGGRMTPFAVVPPYGDDDCLAELDRCVKALGMRGVQLSAHYGNHYLDAPLFRPFLKRVAELGVPAYVHHTPLPVDYSSLLDYNNLRRSYGRCQDQVTAIGREIFSDLFIELPNLRLVHSMMGGGFFAYTSLFFPTDSGHGRFQTAGKDLLSRLKENIYYETSHAQPWGKAQLELAVSALGADHILYGSSYPVKDVWLSGGPAFVRALDISDAEKALVLGENARTLYKM